MFLNSAHWQQLFCITGHHNSCPKVAYSRNINLFLANDGRNNFGHFIGGACWGLLCVLYRFCSNTLATFVLHHRKSFVVPEGGLLEKHKPVFGK